MRLTSSGYYRHCSNKSAAGEAGQADVSGNLAVNFVTILVIAGLLFGLRGLDGMLASLGHRAGVLEVQHGAPK
jgi:hypothetical protein